MQDFLSTEEKSRCNHSAILFKSIRLVKNISWKISLLVVLGIIIIAAGILLQMGRPLFCQCGVISLWCGDIWSNQTSQQLADPYTFSHVIHGALFYFFLRLAGKRWPVALRLILAVALEAGWEILENSDFIINRYREATISLDYYGDSVFNSIGDILAMIAGFFLAFRLPVKATVCGIILVELLLLYFIRDNLTLNILMLLYPIPAIKAWQLGG